MLYNPLPRPARRCVRLDCRAVRDVATCWPDMRAALRSIDGPRMRAAMHAMYRQYGVGLLGDAGSGGVLHFHRYISHALSLASSRPPQDAAIVNGSTTPLPRQHEARLHLPARRGHIHCHDTRHPHDAGGDRAHPTYLSWAVQCHDAGTRWHSPRIGRIAPKAHAPEIRWTVDR